MNKISPSASTCAQTITRKLRLTSKRGRLIALFVLACAAVTVTAASSAASLKQLLPAAPSGSNTPAATDGRGESRQPGLRDGEGSRGLAAGETRDANEDAPSLTTDKEAYEPGDRITFTGTNWAPGETVTIRIQSDPRDGQVVATATADDNGSFGETGAFTVEGEPNTDAIPFVFVGEESKVEAMTHFKVLAE